MLANLQALGLDPKNLPPIEKLDPRALRGVMKLIAKSLGSKCVDCHREGDFALMTPRKKIATKMWDEFVTKLVFAADDAPLFCDSCHQGRTNQLDRSDLKALGKWMDDSFVVGLKRKDDKDNACETCHVDRGMRFLNNWAGGAAY
jgi:Cytochrome c7 and related cytochrome c